MKTRLSMPAQHGSIPVLGLGVFQIAPNTTQRVVEWALEAGYRHIDTARLYNNEQAVGAALRASGLERGEVFITTKLRNQDQGYDSALRACEASLLRMGLTYLDLYLIHWPEPKLRRDSWDALVALHERGLCRAVGVSNYTVRHLTELLAESALVPAINQVECHPFLQQRALRTFCQQQSIVVEAYSPLARGARMQHPVLVEMASRLGRTPAQLLVRWGIEHGMVVLPKSEHRERIIENAEALSFGLSPDDLALLDTLEEGLHTAWDPTHVA